MRLQFLRLAARLHELTFSFCRGLLLILVTAQITIVILRYVFAVGFLELQGVVNYSFAVLVVLGIPVALRLDKHVRVDVFRRAQRSVIQRTFDRAAIIALLMPLFGITFYFVMPDILFSWSILEGARETGGLPGYFLVKTCLPISCVLMIIQGLALLLSVPNDA